MWFTVTASNYERGMAVIENIERRAGITVKHMPAEKCFKLNVSFSHALPENRFKDHESLHNKV
jgi:hypothetical protein